MFPMSDSTSWPDDASHEQGVWSLTPRQREIACLLVQGLTEREVADQIYVSPATVHEHARHIRERLGVHSRVEMTATIVRAGLCDQPK